MCSRTVVRWVATLFAVIGWGGALLLSVRIGPNAGADGGFVLFIALAITATISLAVSVVLPDQVRIHALGVREGMALARCERAHADRSRHLVGLP